jgi:hypothetical protein
MRWQERGIFTTENTEDTEEDGFLSHFRAEGDHQAKARSKYTLMNTDIPASGGGAVLMPGLVMFQEPRQFPRFLIWF